MQRQDNPKFSLCNPDSPPSVLFFLGGGGWGGGWVGGWERDYTRILRLKGSLVKPGGRGGGGGGGRSIFAAMEVPLMPYLRFETFAGDSFPAPDISG